MFENVHDVLEKSKRPPSMSAHRFQNAVIGGVSAGNYAVEIINSPLIRHYPDYPKVIYKENTSQENGIKRTNIGFINLVGINYLTKMIQLTRKLKSIVKENRDEVCCFVLYNSYLPQSIALNLIKKRYSNVKTCNIVADLHGKYGLDDTKKSIRKIGTKIVGMLEDYFGKKHDSFVFLTEYMNNVFNKRNAPYVIIEGMYENDCAKEGNNEETDKKVIFYAGAVREEYGVEHLLRAFKLISDKQYQLVIAGSGDMEDVVKEYAEEDSRILYLGYISPEEVMYYQNKATVLVNPRENKYEYVKYSFPSKTMESLASGKPFIAHKLQCNPVEYDDLIQYVEGDNDSDLAKKIVEICSLSQERRSEIGQVTRKYILENKNPQKQMSKLIQLLDECNRSND